ncbi:MAG: hypothetical protein ACYS21_16620 [Planctomycetota bacterium]
MDEVWVVNSAAQTLICDKIFVMDDLQQVQSKYPDWATYLRTVNTPIITCRKYPEWKSSHAYPIEEVCASVKDDLFTNTVAYMVGYAIYKEVRELYLYGCDFHYPNSQALEAGSANVAYLLGIAKERGMNYKIPQESTLLDAHLTQYAKKTEDGLLRRPLYGYDWNPGDAYQAVQANGGNALQQEVAGRQPKLVKKKANGEADAANP